MPFLTTGEYAATPVKDIEADRQHRASDGKVRGRSKRSNDPSPTADSEIEVTVLIPCLLINPAMKNHGTDLQIIH